MSTDRDVSRIVRSWLEEGVTALPDRVLDNVLDRLPATSQRRAWWPVRRLIDMNIPTRLAVAVAAVIALAVIGAIAIPKGAGVGQQSSPAPTTTLVPTPIASPAPLPSTGALGAGTYYIPAGSLTPARMTITVPAGWKSGGDGFVTKDNLGPAASPLAPGQGKELTLVTWVVSHAYTDVCHWQGKLTPVGTTADQLVTVLHDQIGRTASTPTDVTLGGLPAKRIDLTVPANLDVTTCDHGIIRFWPDPGPDESGGLCCSHVGSTDVVYALVSGGRVFAVVARHQSDSSAQDLAELDGIVASIRFGP